MFDTVTASDTVYYNCNKIRCEKCDGTGFQQRKDGIWILCPICDGDGWRTKKVEIAPCNPYTPKVMPYPTYPWCAPDVWYTDNTPKTITVTI